MKSEMVPKCSCSWLLSNHLPTGGAALGNYEVSKKSVAENGPSSVTSQPCNHSGSWIPDPPTLNDKPSYSPATMDGDMDFC